MGRLALIVVVVGGCGRLDFDATSDAGDACVQTSWTAPREFDTVDSSKDDWGQYLSEDRLTLIFSSDRAGAPTTYDLYIATRSDANGPFGPPSILSQSNAIEDDAWLDGQRLWFNDNRSGDMDIYVGTLGDLGNANVEPGISTTGVDEQCPELSKDRLTLYYESDALGTKDIYRVSRATTGSPWGTPERLSLSTGGFDCCLSISDDGQVVYVSDNGISSGVQYVMYAQTSGTGFTQPVPFAATMNMGNATDVYITRDGRTVVSALDKGDGNNSDMYISDRVCP